MYLDYFSLNRHPFRITPDPSLFFPGGADGRGVVLNALIYAITSGEGILKVVGEVGSGKTMLCRMLEEQLPDNVEIVYIANPSLSAREILYAIAIELRLDVTASTERLKVLHLIQNYLLDKHGKGGSVVVFVEEAQSMPLETLEEIRLLNNLETHQHKLMQIVLFGQPELDKILAQKNIRQLRERITHSFNLEPLSGEATSEYIRYRLKVAGCPRTHLFSPRAEKMIARASSGLTRRINILADKALLAAYADSPSRQPAQDGSEPLVLARHVRAAIRDTDYRRKTASPWLLGGVVAAAVVAVALFVVLRLDPFGSATATSATLQASEAVLEESEATLLAARETEAAIRTGRIARDVAVEEEGADTAAAADDDQASAETVTEAVAETTTATSTATSTAETPPPSAAASPGADPAPETPDSRAPDAPAPTDAALAARTQPAATAGDSGAGTPETVQAPAPRAAQADEGGAIAPAPEPSASTPAAPREETVAQGSAGAVPALTKSPVTMVPSGLAELRMAPTADWLRGIGDKRGYTIVLFSVPSTNPDGLEEYLQFLQLVSLLDDTYICFKPVSSPTSGRWQVMHREFQGVTPARNLLRMMPEYILQYNPYVSNLDAIQCSYPVRVGRR